jgi:glycosyltransferase involved in cell wall biosynthesis
VKPRLVVIGPLPPPYHGVTVSTSLVLENPALHRCFDVEHFDTSDHRTTANIGHWDARNVIAALSQARGLWKALAGRPGLVYLPISQGLPGLTRDTVFIRVAAARGWRVATHLRGSELGDVYRRQPAAIRAWLRRAFDRVDSMGVLGESLRPVVAEVVSAERVAVVPNGTPDPQLDGRSRAGDTGLFLSNLRPRKGVWEALAAALTVVTERSEARFVFAGDCPDEAIVSELRNRAKQARGRIEIRSAVTGRDKLDLLASSAFLVFPPKEPEGQPRVILEAMAAGLPVITTDRGAIAETVIDGECGYVLPDPVPERLAERLLRLYDDPELREEMGRAARRRYLERFTQAAADSALADWLARVASMSPAAKPVQ